MAEIAWMGGFLVFTLGLSSCAVTSQSGLAPTERTDHVPLLLQFNMFSFTHAISSQWFTTGETNIKIQNPNGSSHSNELPPRYYCSSAVGGTSTKRFAPPPTSWLNVPPPHASRRCVTPGMPPTWTKEKTLDY